MSRVSVTCEKCGKSTQRAERNCTRKPCPKCGGPMARKVPGLKPDAAPEARFHVSGSRSPFEGMRMPLVALPDEVRVERGTLQELRSVSRRRPAEIAARILNDWAKARRAGQRTGVAS